MHHICNFVRLCYNNNKNTLKSLKKRLKSAKNIKKYKKTIKNMFLNFYKKT